MGLAIAASCFRTSAPCRRWCPVYVREPIGLVRAVDLVRTSARAGIAVALLTPITLLMGGTLTLLIRHLVRSDLEIGGWRIAVLYGINTAGAALGAVVTDFVLVPAVGLWGTQMVAVFFNVDRWRRSLVFRARSVSRGKVRRQAGHGDCQEKPAEAASSKPRCKVGRLAGASWRSRTSYRRAGPMTNRRFEPQAERAPLCSPALPLR